MKRFAPNMDLSGFVDRPMKELIPVVEAAAKAKATRNELDRVGSLLFDRTLHLLREGSRTQILAECVDLDRFLTSKAGKWVEGKYPELFGSWTALSDLLSEAARRSDRAAIESILRSHKGLGQQLLEQLAAHGGPLLRSEVRDRLGLSESHVSHLLRELDEADLIVRYRHEGKGVAIDLGGVGREIVERSVVPAWIDVVVQHLKRLLEENAEPVDIEPLTAELIAKGAPSRLAARRLAEALTPTHKTLSHVAEENLRRLFEDVRRKDQRFDDLQRVDSRPLGAFAQSPTVH